MFFLLQRHPNEKQLELELILAVGTLLVFAMYFIFATFLRRAKRLKKEIKSKKYQTVIDDLVSKLLFEKNGLSEGLIIYREYETKKLFNKLLLKALVGLHKNYVGEQKLRIEQFYSDSSLCQFSLSRLNSLKWVNLVEAVRDLSKLNYQESYPLLLKLLNHRKPEVQKEAFIGLVLLKGIPELEKHKNSKLYLDDWTQTNLLYSIKIKQWNVGRLEAGLFESANETFLLLVCRLIELYHVHSHYDDLMLVYDKIDNPKIKNDISNIIKRLK